MMDVRKRLYIFASIIVGILLAFILLVLFFTRRMPAPSPGALNQGRTTQTSAPSGNTPSAETIPSPSVSQTQVTSTPPNEYYVEQLSRMFVERVGSYSNQNHDVQLREIAPFATNRVLSYFRSRMASLGNASDGSSTKVVVVKIRSYNDTKATVGVDVQQILLRAGTNQVVYKTGRVELVHDGDIWKVDGLFWE